MKLKVEENVEVSPKVLAEGLANSSPEEFAKFWFEFSEVCSLEKLNAFAKVMAPTLGYNRLKVLKELLRLTAYYETQTDMKENGLLKGETEKSDKEGESDG